MLSVRRRRRGRRVRAAAVAASVVGGEIIFVVINFSVVILDRARLTAESPPHGLVRAVGAEPFAADDATFQVRHFFGVAASGTVSIVEQEHRSGHYRPSRTT